MKPQKLLRKLMQTDVLDVNTKMFRHIVRRVINVREIALIFGKARNDIMIEFYEDIIRQTIECYGTGKQSVVCMEECCELVQAISKELRGKSDKEHLTEEMADVLICMEMLKIMYHVTDDELNEWVKKKQFRQLKRITESGVVTGYVAGYEQAFEDLDKAILDNEVCNQNMNGDCYEEIMKIMGKLRKEIKNDRE